jgi:hypothetical protein
VLPASLAATLLTAVGASVAVQVVSYRLGRPVLRPRVTARIMHLTWSDPVVTAVGGGLALAGLLFVLAAVVPGRTATAPLAGDDPGFVTGLGRASLRAALRAAVLDVPGADAATVRLRGRLRPRAEIRVVTGFHDHDALGEQVADAVRDRLQELNPVRAPEVAVRICERKD